MDWDLDLPDFGQAVQDAAKEVFDNIVRRTPVDSGAARDAWVFQEQESGNARMSNDVPYINRLENGYSDQAPVGMIRISLEEFEDILKRNLERKNG